MLLNGEQIKKQNLIEGSSDSMFKAASYNLRIAKIVPVDGKEVSAYALPSLGMVEVVSAEKVHLPKEIAGYATVKTSLCNEGILAINIGIVDPGYNGLISSTLINFGKNSYYLEFGQEFLRLTFHEYKAQDEVPALSAQKPDAEYIKDKKLKVLAHFSSTFLNIEEKIAEITNRVANRVLGQWKKGFFVWVPVAAATLAFLTFLLNWASLALNEKYIKESMKNEIRLELMKEQQVKTPDVEPRIGAMEQKLRELDETINKLKSGGPKQQPSSSTGKP